MVEGALITGGIMISYWLDFGMSFAPGQAAWRFPIAFQIVFALIIFTTILGLPESPRWLILKGRQDEALEVLCALNEAEPNDEYIQNEFTAIKETVLEMSKGSFRDLFTMDENRHFHRTVLAYVNQMFQQISGINLITYYAATIYQNSLGFDGVTSRLFAACNGTEYFLASWIAVFTVEKVGRRKLMLIGVSPESEVHIRKSCCEYLTPLSGRWNVRLHGGPRRDNFLDRPKRPWRCSSGFSFPL